MNMILNVIQLATRGMDRNTPVHFSINGKEAKSGTVEVRNGEVFIDVKALTPKPKAAKK